MRATVLVRPKPGILDPQGEAVRGSLGHLGFSVDAARVGRLIDLELEGTDQEAAREQVDAMCRQLLANPLIESYEITLEGRSCVGSTEQPKSEVPAVPAPERG